MTNVKVDFQLVPFDGIGEKRNLALASSDYLDSFHTLRIPTSDLMLYESQRIFIKLNELTDKHARIVRS
ncbi:hypothetical protein ACFQI7_13460 [Paenibacillus allorhizosphaerae]|uniref:hypothetical protein n=1 Tax=Paenibacillus allorhizosphaerae TaxID=2849866 RepID=UPI001C407F29|nr:hypothetical protein [Paenibacillus allorhizosphaerae]